MAITYPIDWPHGLRPRSIEWKAENSVVYTESPFSKKLKIYDFGGKRWRATVTLPVMELANARRWIAWFLSLNGIEGTFYLKPSLESAPTGSALGTPLVKGGSQTGQSLETDGWDANQSQALKAGDWIQVGSFLYRTLRDVAVDGSGNATIDIWPNLRSSPSDNAPVIIYDTKGLFRLEQIPSVVYNVQRLAEGVSFDCIEAI